MTHQIQPWSAPTTQVPWEQMPGEPPEAFVWFMDYVNRDGTIQAWIDHHRPEDASISVVRTTATRWRWRARREALRFYQNAQATQAEARALADRIETHGQAWALVYDWAIQSLLHRIAVGEILDAKEALVYLKEATQAQRTLAAEMKARASAVDLSETSDEVLDDLQALLDQVDS